MRNEKALRDYNRGQHEAKLDIEYEGLDYARMRYRNLKYQNAFAEGYIRTIRSYLRRKYSA